MASGHLVGSTITESDDMLKTGKELYSFCDALGKTLFDNRDLGITELHLQDIAQLTAKFKIEQ